MPARTFEEQHHASEVVSAAALQRLPAHGRRRRRGLLVPELLRDPRAQPGDEGPRPRPLTGSFPGEASRGSSYKGATRMA